MFIVSSLLSCFGAAAAVRAPPNARYQSGTIPSRRGRKTNAAIGIRSQARVELPNLLPRRFDAPTCCGYIAALLC
jgi:hypothetical protein